MPNETDLLTGEERSILRRNWRKPATDQGGGGQYVSLFQAGFESEQSIFVTAGDDLAAAIKRALIEERKIRRPGG